MAEWLEAVRTLSVVQKTWVQIPAKSDFAVENVSVVYSKAH